MPRQRERLGGWGNYPVEQCQVSRPATLRALRALIAEVGEGGITPRGLGRSYGDSALNQIGCVAELTQCNHCLAFDEQTGMLECEAGVSFAEIIQHFLPRGWFLPVTPGTQFVTVGGAIAADVHGKNHHVDGSFGNFVEELTLWLASGEARVCSRTQHADLFWATLGGMGLTGVILSARFRLRRVESGFCDVTYRRTRNLEDTLRLFDDTNANYRYSVAWIDCLATGSSLGRCVLMLGNELPAEALPPRLRRRPFALPQKPRLAAPFYLPGMTLNRWSMNAFNGCYYAVHRDKRAIVDLKSYFYPLDGIEHWNRIYGRQGFVQYQALFPKGASHEGLRALLEEISRSQRASFLAVLKSSGAESGGLLSYMLPGHTLALDFAATPGLTEFVARLDEILLKYNGRLYLAKDALMTPEAFAAMYPRLGEFRAIKSQVDPQNRFASTQSRRVKIMG